MEEDSPTRRCLFIRNFVGQKLTDEELRHIPYPKTEIVTHVTMKSLQLMSFVGGITALGKFYYDAKKVEPALRAAVIKEAAFTGAKIGLLGGFALGPLATLIRFQSIHWDEEGILDRAYRLRHSNKQLRIDRACLVGAVAGYGIAAGVQASELAIKESVNGGLGFIAGMNAGLILTILYNSIF
ncbi:hypothetical protein ACOME3_000141 [Neoechinorhynchus agilis]